MHHLDLVFSEKSSEAPLITIGAMAQLCGVTVRTLRYYEEMDLIGPAKRSSGKYRLYPERMVKRVKAILALQDLSYSLEEIVEILGPYSKTLGFNKQEQVAATRRSLEEQKACIDSKLSGLLQLKEEIDARLKIVAGLCEPCLKQSPNECCQDACSHRDVHIN